MAERRRRAWLVVAVTLLLGAAGPAWGADPVAVLTEIRPGQGEVRVKLAGESEWKAPQPLQALRPGDQIRASSDARATVVFTGARAAQTVTGTSSPFTVPTPGAGGGGERVGALVSSVTSFLVGKQDKPAYVSAYVPATTRRMPPPPPPMQLSPRETRVAADQLSFEWSGSDFLRYRVRLLGPSGALVWEAADLPRKPLAYPTGAPALEAGRKYVWELHSERHPVLKTEFEILPTVEAARIKRELDMLTPSALRGQSASTVALVRAGLLLKEGLKDGARRELVTAIAADPEEPSLHQLLGHVYDGMGMQQLAAEEFDEARYLSQPKP
jgi:hypothetical protein